MLDSEKLWRGRGKELIRGWVLINFYGLQGGRLFEVGAYAKLGTFNFKVKLECRSIGRKSLKLRLDYNVVFW